MKRLLLAALLLGVVACADDDDLAEPDGDGDRPRRRARVRRPPRRRPWHRRHRRRPRRRHLDHGASHDRPPETTTTVDPDVDPAVAFTEVATLDGGVVDLAWRTGDDALYVVEQAGRVTRLAGDAPATVLDITDLTDADGERGLLGLAFDPTGQFAYVNYTDGQGDTVISEHPVDGDGQFGTGDSARLVLEIEQPYANHNGGDLTFGPDGMLYIGMGDGGSGGDPERRATDMTTLLGKMLRIDPACRRRRAVRDPRRQPVRASMRHVSPEIWASGLRNPWRFSFDRETGDLWIADVGQNAVEEIDVAPATGGLDAGKGLSFGWSAFEGDERFNDDVARRRSRPADRHVRPRRRVLDQRRRPRQGRPGAGAGRMVRVRRLLLRAGVGAAGHRRGRGDGGRTQVELGQVESATAVVDGPGGEIYVLSANGTVYRLDPA